MLRPHLGTVLLWAAWGAGFTATIPAATPLPSSVPQHHTEALGDRSSILTDALCAGGITDSAQQAGYQTTFVRVCEAEAPAIRLLTDDMQRITALLDCLHRQFLTGEYRAEYSELHRTLDDGHYNCVSSTILFRALCEYFDVEALPVLAGRHLLCQLPGTPPLPIETTCRAWPLGEHSRELGNVSESRVLTDAELIAKVSYNQGVAHLSAGRYPPAIAALRRAWAADPQDQAALDNLLAAHNNWALTTSDDGRFEDAVALIVAGLSLAPDYPPLRANDLHVHQKWVQQLCAQRRYAEALSVLERAYRRRPDAALFERGRSAILARWAGHLFQTGEFDPGWRKLKEAALRGTSAADTTRHEARMAASIYRELVRSGQAASANRFLAEAVRRYPHADVLRQCGLDLPQSGT
ncbi:MAG: hypothetical protein AB7F89_10310 [Pirellulaceae bacterium]